MKLQYKVNTVPNGQSAVDTPITIPHVYIEEMLSQVARDLNIATRNGVFVIHLDIVASALLRDNNAIAKSRG